eukprot:1160547-Pelagomonas_calceolata.AAC.2
MQSSPRIRCKEGSRVYSEAPHNTCQAWVGVMSDLGWSTKVRRPYNAQLEESSSSCLSAALTLAETRQCKLSTMQDLQLGHDKHCALSTSKDTRQAHDQHCMHCTLSTNKDTRPAHDLHYMHCTLSTSKDTRQAHDKHCTLSTIKKMLGAH